MKRYYTFAIIFLMSLSLWSLGCNHKPAYEDIKVEQPVKADGQATEAKPADPVAEVDRKAAAEQQANSNQPAAQPNAPTTDAKPFVMPTFFDTTKNEIKDLPKYPKAQVTNMQYGPIGDGNVVFVVLQTSDPIEKISTFYDSELKRNGWTIVSNDHDAAYFEWTLKKGDTQEGSVKIGKDENTRLTFISLTRTEKKAEKKP